MTTFEPLTDLQWEKLKPLLPAPLKRGRGKPHSSWRSVINSILFVLITKAKWGSWTQSNEYASKSAAHRWYLHWEKTGLLDQIIETVREFKPDLELAAPQRRTHTIREVVEPESMIIEIPLYHEIENLEHTHKISSSL